MVTASDVFARSDRRSNNWMWDDEDEDENECDDDDDDDDNDDGGDKSGRDTVNKWRCTLHTF